MNQRISIFDLTKNWNIESKIKLEKELMKFLVLNNIEDLEEFYNLFGAYLEI
jgi:hypothetical protein